MPQRRWDEALATLARLVGAHGVELIAIGNGTASRETDKLAADLVTALGGVTKAIAAFGAFVDVGVHQDACTSRRWPRPSSRTRATWSSPATSCG